ncbi:MAG: thioredoxin family protein [Magnetococcales bacterium]|nr:thioredoxin family protein [Magnetococcales bacterium]
MVLLHTPPGELGFVAPDFSLKGTDGNKHTLKDYKKSSVLVVMFICNHCPYVKAIESRLIDLAAGFSKKEAVFVAINSNDQVRYPEDSFKKMKSRAKKKKYPFDYLVDEKQLVAKEYGAVCTPDFFVFNSERKLCYRGRLDDSPRNPKAVKNEDLKLAIQALLANEPIAEPQHASMGCSIKWIDGE